MPARSEDVEVPVDIHQVADWVVIGADVQPGMLGLVTRRETARQHALASSAH
jgi:hypothetical protein